MNVAGAAGATGVGGAGAEAGTGAGEGGGGGAFEPHPDRRPSIGEWRRLLRRIARKQKRASAYEALVVHVLTNWHSVTRNQVHGTMMAIDKAYGRRSEMVRM